MSGLPVICRNATTFTPTGELDEVAFRQFLRIFVESGIGLYLASGGSGEGHALSWQEIRRVYEIAVAECKGKIPVYANPPEQNTARATIAHCLMAAECGVEVINLYGPAAWHGYRPTDAEFIAYHEQVLGAVRHPVALAPNPSIGYSPKAALIAGLADRFGQVVAVNLSGQGDSYFIELKDRMKRAVDIYVQIPGCFETLALGAAGLLVAEANIIPKTHRRFADLYDAGDTVELAMVYAQLKRFTDYVAKWHHSSPRWVKTAMAALKLPGGEGGAREPYRALPPAEARDFIDGLLRLGIPELDELARRAGIPNG